MVTIDATLRLKSTQKPTMAEGEFGEGDTMENLPVLFLPKVNLPADQDILTILRKLEFIYGQHKGIDVREFPTFFSIYFPNKTMANKLKQDGLDFGNSIPIYCNNLLEHLFWEVEQTKKLMQRSTT